MPGQIARKRVREKHALSLMDALRRSVRGDTEAPPKTAAKKTARREGGHGLSLVKSAPKKKAKARIRKSA